MHADRFNRLSLPLSRFHFEATCITNVERTCHMFLSPVADINHIIAIIIMLVRM
jgi:hypothetical protein